jgi:hypothetical protein
VADDAIPGAAAGAPSHFALLAGIGYPRPLSFEAALRTSTRTITSGELVMMPAVTVGGIEANQIGVAAALRVFPLKTPLFIGLRGGFQRTTLTRDVALPYGERLSAKATTETAFINPRAGVMWTWRGGLTMSIDVGVHIPVGAALSVSLPNGASPEATEKLAKMADALGNAVVPSVDLLRVGMMF